MLYVTIACLRISVVFGRPYYQSRLWYKVCLSVTFCIVAKWCILANKKA